MKANELMAEALVEQGYCYRWYGNEWFPKMLVIKDNDDGDRGEALQYLCDTIEGRRQADALEDWLMAKHYDLWTRMLADGTFYDGKAEQSEHKWRLDRIKWCFEQLAGESDE